MTPSFEFDPIRKGLHTAAELLAGYDPARPETYIDSLDFKIMREYVTTGGAQPKDFLTGLMRSLHDATITQHLADALVGKRAAAIMGGHSIEWSDDPKSGYAQTASIARSLAERDLLVLSGGGPGAIEASHLGALFAWNDRGLSEALTYLVKTGQTRLPPDANKVVSTDGSPNMPVVEGYAAWAKPAVELWEQCGKRGAGISLPTFQYGQEPFSPFPSLTAKYFQNSIREDGLLAVATNGIIYVQGSAGTLQEVFQDAAQNLYHTFPATQGAGYFSPMVFFGSFWNAMPVKPVLEVLFAKDDHKKEFDAYVKFTDDIAEAVDFLSSFNPPRANLTIASLASRNTNA